MEFVSLSKENAAMVKYGINNYTHVSVSQGLIRTKIRNVKQNSNVIIIRH